jgi:hypothetical protein
MSDSVRIDRIKNPVDLQYSLPLLLQCHNERMGIEELRSDHGASCGWSAVGTATMTYHALHREGGRDSHSPTAVDDECH